MVGRHTTEELAAASFVNNFFNVALLACMGFTYGLTPLIGAFFSRGDKAAINRYTRIGLRVNLLFTLAVSAVMFSIYFFLHRMGQPEELLPFIRPYYLIVLAGLVPVCVFNVFAQWSFGIGNTVVPTAILIAGNVLNIIGNYILIYGALGAPELGLTGAGLSTLGTRVVVMAAMVWVFMRGALGRPYRTAEAERKETGVAATVARTGFPVSMQMTFETAAFSGSAIIAGLLGKIPLAALQIIITMGMFGFCIYYSIGGATAIVLSHAAGRGDNAAMRRCAADGYIITLTSMAAACVLFIFAGADIVRLFTPDAAVIAEAVAVILPMVIYQFGDATQINFANALRGTSHVGPMLWIAFCSYLVVGLPSTYLLAITAGMGLYGIVLSFSISLMMAGALYLLYFLRATRPIHS